MGPKSEDREDPGSNQSQDRSSKSVLSARINAARCLAYGCERAHAATNISLERFGYAQMAITSDRVFVTLEIDRIER